MSTIEGSNLRGFLDVILPQKNHTTRESPHRVYEVFSGGDWIALAGSFCLLYIPDDMMLYDVL